MRAHSKGGRGSARAMEPALDVQDGPAGDAPGYAAAFVFGAIAAVFASTVFSPEVEQRRPARAHWPTAEVERLGVKVFGNDSDCEDSWPAARAGSRRCRFSRKPFRTRPNCNGKS